jgi:hypothetical protein
MHRISTAYFKATHEYKRSKGPEDATFFIIPLYSFVASCKLLAWMKKYLGEYTLCKNSYIIGDYINAKL